MVGSPAGAAHPVTRPSLLVVAERGVLGPYGDRSVSVTGIEAAGRPAVVSRTWQVIGGRFWDMAVEGCWVFAAAELLASCDAIATARLTADGCGLGICGDSRGVDGAATVSSTRRGTGTINGKRATRKVVCQLRSKTVC